MIYLEEGKKGFKRLYALDEEMGSSKLKSKRVKREMEASSKSEGEFENFREVVGPKKRKLTPNSKGKRISRGKIIEETIGKLKTGNEIDQKEKRSKRKKRKIIDRSVSPGKKRRKKRVTEEKMENKEREKPIKLYDPMAGLELFDVRPELKFRKREGVREKVVEDREDVIEKKNTEEIIETSQASKEIMKKDKFANMLKVFDFAGEKIESEAGNEKIRSKTVERKVQTDFRDKKSVKGDSMSTNREEYEKDLENFETITETEDSREFQRNDKNFGRMKQKRFSSSPQKHRICPKNLRKRLKINSESYYTDPEYSTQKRKGHESCRSTLSDEYTSERRIFANRRDRRRGEHYDRYDHPCRRIPERSETTRRVERRRRRRSPRRCEDFDSEEGNSHIRARSCYDFPYYDERRYRRSMERRGFSFPGYSPTRYSAASGDSAPASYEDSYRREFSPKMNLPMGEKARFDMNERRRFNVGEKRYKKLGCSEDEERRRIKEMFEPDNRREKLSSRKERWAVNDYRDRESRRINQIPMYDPSNPLACESRNETGTRTTFK